MKRIFPAALFLSLAPLLASAQTATTESRTDTRQEHYSASTDNGTAEDGANAGTADSVHSTTTTTSTRHENDPASATPKVTVSGFSNEQAGYIQTSKHDR